MPLVVDDVQAATTSRVHANVVLLTNRSMSRSSLHYLEEALASNLMERDFPFFDGSEPLQDLFAQRSTRLQSLCVIVITLALNRLSVSFVPISSEVYPTLTVVLHKFSFGGICDADLLGRLLDELLQELHLTSNRSNARLERNLILVMPVLPQLSFVTGLLPHEVASVQSVSSERVALLFVLSMIAELLELGNISAVCRVCFVELRRASERSRCRCSLESRRRLRGDLSPLEPEATR